MKVRNWFLFGAVAAVALAQQPQAGTHANFTGTWKLNEAKSKFPPGASKNTTVVYEAAGDVHSAATAYAEEIGSEHVAVNVLPQVREANRFYAKIGFTPLVVRRVASVATLRRSLGLEPADHGRRAGMLARRRSALRARATTPV